MITIAIQAGGQSRRMGRDKGLVPLNNKPMIEHVLTRLEGIAEEIIITTNQPENYEYLGLPLFTDRQPQAGALAGLETAVKAANGDYVFVVACDMPFVSSKLVKYITARAKQADVIVPHFEDRYQPLHALYNKSTCMPAIKTVLAENKKRVISFFPLVSVQEISAAEIKPIDPTGRSFQNINTPEELTLAEIYLNNSTIVNTSSP
ncbi:MAG: molybdenum cofactor guanylyltransferase [Chloroflexota bacterium]